jgi:hypothetical protein
MLITKTHHDVPSKLDNGRPIRIFVISPVVPNYPQAKFPGTLLKPLSVADRETDTSSTAVVCFRYALCNCHTLSSRADW